MDLKFNCLKRFSALEAPSGAKYGQEKPAFGNSHLAAGSQEADVVEFTSHTSLLTKPAATSQTMVLPSIDIFKHIGFKIRYKSLLNQ